MVGPVTVPKNVESSVDMFNGCSNLREVILEDGITTIGQWAFYNCTSLRRITIPASVENVDISAFSGWDSTQTIYLKGRTKEPETTRSGCGSGFEEGWRSETVNLEFDN